MGGGAKETYTADGLLVVSRLPGRHWPLLALGAVLGGVPLARAIDGPGGLAPPAGTSFLMAALGLMVLAYWLMLRTVDEVLRKGLSEHATAEDATVVSLRPTWTVRRGGQPLLGAFVHDRSGPIGWLPMLRLHSAFDPRAPFAAAGGVASRKASLLRARSTGQAVVGVVSPIVETGPEVHPLAARAEELMGWTATPAQTLAGAHGFEPVNAATGTSPVLDPELLRAAAGTGQRRRTLLRAGTAVAVAGTVVMAGNGAGDAGLAVATGVVAASLAARAGIRWVGRPLADLLVARGAAPADARTLAEMLLAAGLGDRLDAPAAPAPPPPAAPPPAGSTF